MVKWRIPSVLKARVNLVIAEAKSDLRRMIMTSGSLLSVSMLRSSSIRFPKHGIGVSNGISEGEMNESVAVLSVKILAFLKVDLST